MNNEVMYRQFVFGATVGFVGNAVVLVLIQ
jgi:hypothetical protein